MSAALVRRVLAAIVLLPALALLASCGSSDRAVSTSAGSANPKVPEPTLADGARYDYKNHSEVVLAVHKAVTECKAAVMASNQITAAEKSELSTACNEGYAAREPLESYATSKAVCAELALLIPDESKQAKQRAFATCSARAKRWR